MAKIVLDGDVSQGIDAPPTHIHATSGVTINNKKIAVDGDSCDPHNGHTPTAIGTKSVTINGKKIIVDNDSLSCGDKIIGSSSVIV